MGNQVLLLALLFISAKGGQPTDATSTPEASASKASGATDDDVLKSSESTDKFTFTQADAKVKKQQLIEKDDNDLGNTDLEKEDNDFGNTDLEKDDNALGNAGDKNLTSELELFDTILQDTEKIFGDDDVTNADNNANKNDDSSDDEDDNDDDDDNNTNDDDNTNDDNTSESGSDSDVEDDDVSSDSSDFPLLVKPKEIPVRRQGDLRPEYGDRRNPEISVPLYLGARDQLDNPFENSPVLQLTQGGYQRPFQGRGRYNDKPQRMRYQSASQQSETLETPTRVSNNGERSGQPQILPQVTYTSPNQPSLGFRAGPVHYPLGVPNDYTGSNGIISSAVQGNFFNAPPSGFADTMSPNYLSQFQASDDNGFPIFQAPPRHTMQNPGLFYQSNPQFPQAIAHEPRSVHPILQPGSLENYPNYDYTVRGSNPDYTPFYHNTHPINHQFQINPHFYGPLPNSESNDFVSPSVLFSSYPGPSDGRFLRYPTNSARGPSQGNDQRTTEQQQDADSPPGDSTSKQDEQINALPNKEDPTSIPFGARIQKQNTDQTESDIASVQDMYLRYPLKEAGYATEESLPAQNVSEVNVRSNDGNRRPPFPFFAAPRQTQSFSSPDPYRNALNIFRQGFPSDTVGETGAENNDTRDIPREQLSLGVPNPIFGGYTNRNQDLPVFQNAPFYPIPGTDDRNPFDPFLPPFSAARSDGNAASSDETPVCAQQSNGSLCFEDAEYPRRELLYSLNSDPFLTERLSLPEQTQDEISLVEQNNTEDPESEDNYICKSDIKKGLPLRAKNTKGTWKVIVNLDRTFGKGQLMQPVRLEVCRGAKEPCNFTTEIKTQCIQKYSLQRLLSWSRDKGIHSDAYKLPVACSCQIVDAKV